MNRKSLYYYTTRKEIWIKKYLLGPNGAGKSAMMHIITDNQLPESGRVIYNGEDILVMDPRFKQLLGYMHQLLSLYNRFNARRFLRYMATSHGQFELKKYFDYTPPKQSLLSRLQNIWN